MSESTFTKQERAFLLKLARRTMEHYLKTGRKLDVNPGELPSARVIEDGAAFVTLYIVRGKSKHLRGCIGTLEARRPLVMDIINNAINAAFDDPRFPPLKREELPNVRIEISILTEPKPLKVIDKDDLLRKLVPGKHGVIIQKGFARATFLPVVWEELKKKEEFLTHLCQKAGLYPDEWKDTREMRFFIYEAEKIEED
ncbi:TPA: AmmeMemoRadiSam system protein A [Candidatus Micrarchaeota archaeon]|nr:AmmeMemoRadiSam system protein A [Candidatus Micrarchaeota archaeon]